MNEILRDTSWQFIISSGIAVLAIIAGFVIYLLQRSKKSLSYEVISNTPLLSTSEEIKNDLQILYKGTPVKNVRLFVLKIINDGNQPIATGDFEKPLYFSFFGGTQILSAEVVSTKPENLNPSISFDDEFIAVEPLLLNSKDFIKIKALINGEKFSFKPDTRIIGVREVKELREFPVKQLFFSAAGLMFGAFFALIISGVFSASVSIIITLLFFLTLGIVRTLDKPKNKNND